MTKEIIEFVHLLVDNLYSYKLGDTMKSNLHIILSDF